MGVQRAGATSVLVAAAVLAVALAPPTTAAAPLLARPAAPAAPAAAARPAAPTAPAAAAGSGVPTALAPPSVAPGTPVAPGTATTPIAPNATTPSASGRAPPDGGLVGVAYTWPLLPPPAVVRPFGAPEDPFGPGHRGVDLAGAVGQPVLAARGGTVAFAGPVAGHGSVSVQHDDGLRTTYEPLLPRVHAGDVVVAGAVLGTLAAGHTGCSAPCLHWGVRRERLEYLDPLVLLRPPRVRLLPVPEPWPDP